MTPCPRAAWPQTAPEPAQAACPPAAPDGCGVLGPQQHVTQICLVEAVVLLAGKSRLVSASLTSPTLHTAKTRKRVINQLCCERSCVGRSRLLGIDFDRIEILPSGLHDVSVRIAHPFAIANVLSKARSRSENRRFARDIPLKNCFRPLQPRSTVPLLAASLQAGCLCFLCGAFAKINASLKKVLILDDTILS